MNSFRVLLTAYPHLLSLGPRREDHRLFVDWDYLVLVDYSFS